MYKRQNEECILDDLVQSENVFDADGKRSGYVVAVKPGAFSVSALIFTS